MPLPDFAGFYRNMFSELGLPQLVCSDSGLCQIFLANLR